MDAWKRDLQTHGFAVVPQVLDPNEVTPLREAVGDAIGGPERPDVLRDSSGQVRKVAYPLAIDERFFLAIAHPELLSLALDASPCPEELVLTWEDVVYKAPSKGAAVPVHQDLAFPSLPGPVYSLALCLDNSADNAVHFLPGSQALGPLTREQVRAVGTTGRMQPAKARAGDVVVHDALCVHTSPENTSEHPRITWYLEFRTSSQLDADRRWPQEWVETRRALLFHACAARQAAGLDVLWPPTKPGVPRQTWLSLPCRKRVPHVSHGVDYDLTSPYFHFDVEGA